MRLRRPRFTLLLTGLVAVAAVAIVVAGGTGGRVPAPRPPQQLGRAGRQRACMTTQAPAQDTARGVLTRTGTATVPLKVTQTVVGPRAAVTVTRGGSFRARVQASRHLAVSEHAVARARAC